MKSYVLTPDGLPKNTTFEVESVIWIVLAAGTLLRTVNAEFSPMVTVPAIDEPTFTPDMSKFELLSVMPPVMFNVLAPVSTVTFEE